MPSAAGSGATGCHRDRQGGRYFEDGRPCEEEQYRGDGRDQGDYNRRGYCGRRGQNPKALSPG